MEFTSAWKTTLKIAPVVVTLAASLSAGTAWGQTFKPVPGYVPPVTMATTPDYADDTRGVFVPSHQQHRMKTQSELQQGVQFTEAQYTQGGDMMLAQADTAPDSYERELNRIANGHIGQQAELNRISNDAGMVQGGAPVAVPPQSYGLSHLGQMGGTDMPQGQVNPYMQAQMAPQANPYAQTPMSSYGQKGYGMPGRIEDGVEVAVGAVQRRSLDMHNSLVRLREDRITIRRALQRMMDQIGAGEWTLVWDLAEQNAGLPEMEVSIYAEEPFTNVLNALLARVQTRSGQPLRVIRYDNTQRLVITDRQGGYRLAGKTSAVGVGDTSDPVAVTENVLKESMVSLHHDEIPLVDALENIVNQAGKGEWRLRVYAGLDQVLKPAHIEEPFNIAMDRLLKLFNLKYEIFPGGKLIVVTHNNRFGYRMGGE